MKKIKITSFFILLPFFTSDSFSQQKNNYGSIIIHITGCSFDKGQIIVSLINSAESYNAKKSPPFRYVYIKSDSSVNSINYTFEKVPFGTYGIQLFYDKNKNDRLDTSFGIPKERYGFSNNIKPIFSKPEYKEITFPLYQEKVVQNIILR